MYRVPADNPCFYTDEGNIIYYCEHLTEQEAVSAYNDHEGECDRCGMVGEYVEPAGEDMDPSGKYSTPLYACLCGSCWEGEHTSWYYFEEDDDMPEDYPGYAESKANPTPVWYGRFGERDEEESPLRNAFEKDD